MLSPEQLKAVADKLDIDAACTKLAKAQTEHAHQRAVFAWLQWMVNSGRDPWMRLAFAVPNGGERNIIVAGRLKSEGVKAGVPDIVWPVPRGRYPGLTVEMKTLGDASLGVKKGSVSELQTIWHNDLRAVGYAVAVCWGWQQARACFLQYAAGGAVLDEYT